MTARTDPPKHEHAWRPPRIEGPDLAPDFARRRAPGSFRLGLMIAGAVIAWGPVLALCWPDRPYPADLLVHFSAHIGALWLVLAAALAMLKRRIATMILGAPGLIVFSAMVWASRPPSPGPLAPDTTRLRIVHFNAYQTATRGDSAFEDWLRAQDADIVCIVDAPWGFWRSPWIAERYPSIVHPIKGLEWPIVILSRYPAVRTRLTPLSNKNWFSFVARRSVLVTVNPRTRVLVSAMHPMSPRTPTTWEHSLSAVELDGGLLRAWSAKTGLPVLMTSDTNSTPLGRLHRQFAKCSGLLGWTRPFGGTWPAMAPSWLGLPIDRIWTSPGLTVRRLEVGPAFRSDHRPIVAEVDIPANTDPDAPVSETDFGGPGPDGSVAPSATPEPAPPGSSGQGSGPSAR